ncbi:MAG: CoA transferase [Lachnospiraceae bacterium]|nr:CoA transferase [Lachnospiraceae bacterium]
MAEHAALENLVVLDLCRVIAGPFCGAMLADLGATVIKIERPGKGDDARAYAPYINGESLYYSNLNRNKYGMTLDMKQEAGKEILRELVKRADILIENFRPGVMDRMGLGYEELKKVNPRLIYGAVSGFGSYGRYHDRPGYDIIAQAMGGLMSITGQKDNPPTRSGNAMGDILGGLNLTIGVLAAVNARNITGEGQRVDVSLTDCVVASLEQAVQRYFVSGKVPERRGNSYEAIAPYDTYEAKDGYVVIGCGNQKLYEHFCGNILHRPELVKDERFLTVPLRVENNLILKEYFEEWTKERTVAEVTDILLKEGIPAGPIYDLEDIFRDRHIAEDREMLVKTTHPVMGDIVLNGNPVKLLGTKTDVTRKPSPTLGEDNRNILMEFLEKSEEECRALEEAKVI